MAFSFPLHQRMIPPLVLGLILFWLIDPVFKSIKSRKSIFTKSFNKQFFIHSSIFWLYLLSLFFTDNFNDLSLIERKLSLLLFPLILFSYKRLERLNLNNIMVAFIGGTIIASVICFGFAYLDYKVTGKGYEFFYTYLSYFTHPTYFSIYCLIALLMLRELFAKQIISIVAFTLISFLMLVMIFLLQSRAGLLALLFIGPWLLFSLLKKGLNWKPIVFSILIFLMGSGIVINQSNYLQTRLLAVFLEKNVKKQEPDIRVSLWKSSKSVLKENWLFGVGPSKVFENLKPEYEKRDLKSAIDKQFNVHNQFIHLWLCLGVFGLIAWLMVLGVPLYEAIIYKEGLFISFILIIALNSFFEVLLNLQAGVVFYSFFNAIFMLQLLKKKNESTFLPTEN